MLDVTELKELMKKKHRSQTDLALAIGTTPQNLNQKFHNKNHLNTEDLYMLCCDLDIDTGDTFRYFKVIVDN